MDVIILTLLICSHLVGISMAGCAIEPDNDGHVTIPSSWTSIGYRAFMYCNALQSVTIGNSVTSIGGLAFYTCKALQSVTIPDSVTSIGHGVFNGCSALQSVTIPNSIMAVPKWSFVNCASLQSVTIPSSVTSIGHIAFRGCSKLQSVTTGSSTSFSIGDLAFQDCSSLTSITFGTTSEIDLGTGVFQGCDELEVLYLNKSLSSISGSLPAAYINRYYCNSGACGCSKGYGNVHDGSSSLYRCVPCEVGKTSRGGVSECKNCAVGTYSDAPGSPTCRFCPKGKYGLLEGGTSERGACKNCSIGTFSAADGSSTCFECPAGSYCKDQGMKIYNQCLPGTYNSYSNQTACSDCPAGRYQPNNGSAICEPCREGKYLNATGSITESACIDCPIGTFNDYKGSSKCYSQCDEGYYLSEDYNCTKCPVGRYNSNIGSDFCSPCPVGYVCESIGLSEGTRCPAGKFGILHDDITNCTACPAGTYQPDKGQATCTGCSTGTYSANTTGATSIDVCKACEAGTYTSTVASTACQKCPPGSHCPNTKTFEYVSCDPGAFTNSSGNMQCQSCPKGSYQDLHGAAYCDLCPVGKYLNEDGAAQRSQCMECPVGKYSHTEGLAECFQCPAGQYQDYLGSSSCKPCKEFGSFMTSNGDSTGCEVDNALANEELIVIMFQKGVALSMSFSISAAFILVCGYMQIHKERAKDDIGQLDRMQVVFKSALPGFSFGSEMFLIFGMWREAPGIARTMLAFRLLHPLLLVYIMCVVFSSGRVKETLTLYSPQAKLWRTYMHMDIAREMLPTVSVVTILCMGDITLVQMLPWKRSVFYTESKGFPSLSLLQLCSSVKTLQSTVSMVCQISYLAANSTLDNPTTTPQAKALFGLNICVSIATVVMGLVMLFLRGSLLETTERKSVANVKEEIPSHDELEYTDNPLLSGNAIRDVSPPKSADDVVEALKVEVKEQQSRIEELKKSNEELKMAVFHLGNNVNL